VASKLITEAAIVTVTRLPMAFMSSISITQIFNTRSGYSTGRIAEAAGDLGRYLNFNIRQPTPAAHTKAFVRATESSNSLPCRPFPRTLSIQ
jgi:hypothetical protein